MIARFAPALALLSVSVTCRSAEPWADARLTVTNGLVVWLDVSRQNAARGALGLTPLQSWRDAPDLLLDGSGLRGHLAQPVLAARPRFRQEFNGAMLAFDGVDDFLAAGGHRKSFQDATLFLVADPHTNGGFRALVSLNATGQNDYTSGLNLDFGSVATANLSRVNAEGAGFSGERNLLAAMTSEGPSQPESGAAKTRPAVAGSYLLGSWQIFALRAGRGTNGVKLFVGGQERGARDRSPDSILRLEDFTLGARRYSNTPDRPHVQGFFQGNLAELLLFDRALSDAERSVVESYLDAKYGALLRGMGAARVREGAISLVTISNPPPVQVFFPGFSARELPVQLNNVNNVRYRPDGKLAAVGYDGRIWLLSDRDGDGLEDTIHGWWDRQTLRAPIGAAVTPPGFARGQGLFVAAKDRLALIVDTNGDDRADEDITVATWTERSEQQGVDALGVAVAPDGSIYFSLGAASFTEPYLIDKATGQARYRTTMERGTIQRVSADFLNRETVCSGIRFAVGLAFNRHGDLFCTDQEGATWLPNGNPFDELLHIQPGRHYGFPPRHPRHLPEVIDEPSVFGYAPQHQSTCGLCFNEPLTPALSPSDGERVIGHAGRSVFGPDAWAGDAIVAGYSRGKLWRTKLVKTSAGYVAQTHLLATLQALTVDVCVSPRGDLIVATHGGLPDWGSGPNGQGKLWRIRYEDRNAPQPVLAWNASPTELKIAFDRPLDQSSLKDLAGKTRVESGKYAAAGDRFETIRPGYQVVYDQLAAPRYVHEVLSTQVSPDLRTLTLVTRPRAAAVNYAITLPALVAAGVRKLPFEIRNQSESSGLSLAREIDLAADLSGVEAHWRSADGQASWAGWLPHLDLKVAREFTRQSADHDQFFSSAQKPGTITLKGQLDLWQLLQPAVQPGSTIDWQPPPEDVTLHFEGAAPFEVTIGGQTASSAATEGKQRAEAKLRGAGRQWPWFEVKLSTGAELAFGAAWSTREDPRQRAFPLRRFWLPWAQPADDAAPTETAVERLIPEIAGGNWLRGRKLFFSETLVCGKCHTIRGEGLRAGPDLSNLIYRDYASVRNDIQFPNGAINPDHVASEVELADGDTVTGIVLREAGGILHVAMGSGVSEQVPRSKVKSVRPSKLSLMPEGIWETMSAEECRDLMTFLLTQPLEPLPLPMEVQGQKPPPARKRAEIEAVLGPFHVSRFPFRASAKAGQYVPPHAPSALRVVLCASAKDPGHAGPGFHDYPLWRERWSKLLSLAEGVVVETADRWPSPEQWRTAQVVAFYHDNPAWSGERAGDLDLFLERGGGLVFLHWSINAQRDVELLARRLGRAWGAGSRFRYGLETLRFQPHELTAGLETVQFTDESYWNLKGDMAGATVLATSVEADEPQPQIWIRTHGRGRIFVCIPGHFTWTLDDPIFRTLVLRGLCWAAGQPSDRLDELATVGARLAE